MTSAADVPSRRKRAHRAREFAWFAGSTVLYQGARFVFSLAAARSLSASDFTAWALVVALLAYAPAILLGVNNGMSRELPILAGRGATEAMERVMAATWATVGLALVAILALAGILGVVAPAIRLEVLVVGLLICGTIVFGVQQFSMRSRLRFNAASVQLALFGGTVLVAAGWLALMPDADLTTAATIYAGPLVGGILLGIALELPTVTRSVDVGVVRRLAAIGFPIMLAGLVFSLFVTLDRWVAVALFGAEHAAPYTLASLIAAAMLIVPTVVSQQTYPRMAIARGRGSSDEELLVMARRQGVAAAGLVLPVALLLVAFAYAGIPALLPAYQAATGAVVALSIGFAGLAFLTGYGNYLNVVGAQWRYLAAQIGGAMTAVPLMVAGGTLFGLTGIAAGMAASHLVYGLLLWGAARRSPIRDA